MGKLDSIVSGWQIYIYILYRYDEGTSCSAREKFYSEIDDMNFLLHCFD